jgi:hypothetical protein
VRGSAVCGIQIAAVERQFGTAPPRKPFANRIAELRERPAADLLPDPVDEQHSEIMAGRIAHALWSHNPVRASAASLRAASVDVSRRESGRSRQQVAHITSNR